MFVVGAIQTALFLGGWNDPFGLIGHYHAKWSEQGFTAGLVGLNVVAGAIFITKAVLIVLVQMWLRWTLPRPRIDQVLYACLKVLMPLACLLLLGGAVWQWLILERPGLPWRDYQPWNLAAWWQEGFGMALVSQLVLATVGTVIVVLIAGWIVYAWLTRNTVYKRLSEAEAIA
jgi:uncharacterized membrane protein